MIVVLSQSDYEALTGKLAGIRQTFPYSSEEYKTVNECLRILGNAAMGDGYGVSALSALRRRARTARPAPLYQEVWP